MRDEAKMNSPANDRSTTRVRPELFFIIAFMATNIAIPLYFSELYPFTIAPMFRDRPECYCNYRVLSPTERDLPLEEFQLQRVYDGNPVGIGGGIKPPPTLNRFGSVPDAATIRRHVQMILARSPNDYPFVDVVQEVIGPTDKSVEVTQLTRIRVHRHEQ